jgi:hypothetical protein
MCPVDQFLTSKKGAWLRVIALARLAEIDDGGDPLSERH